MRGLYKDQERNRVYFRMTFWEYVKSRRYILLLFAVCSLLHVVVLFVYGCDPEPVLYATFLYVVLLLGLGIYDFFRKRRKWKILQKYDSKSDKRLWKIITENEPVGIAYQGIVSRLEDELRGSIHANVQKEKELSDFYTMWVHQIKTPIAALRLLLQTTPENVSGMKGELFKIERYVDIVLNYLRMEDMGGDLLLRHYSVEAMVKQVVKKYSPLFIQSKLSLKLEDLEKTVLTDEKWMVFVLEQILSNALKYTKKGYIRVSASVSELNNIKTTELMIEDTGIGICAEDLPRIFERSYTGYNGRDDKKASGLGLYLCKNILQKLGHEIVISSLPGQGTVVKLIFHEDSSFCGNLTKL